MRCQRILYKIFLPGVSLLLTLILSTVPARAEPCCGITDIDTKKGVVSASETTTGRQFKFRLTNPILVHRIKVGQGVEADFAAGKATVVGIDGRYPIIGTAPAASGAKGPSVGALGSLPEKNTRPTTPANKICCAITAVDARSGVISVRENATGRNFKFVANKKSPLKGLKPGQGVYAHFASKQVSLDGRFACCRITELSAASTDLRQGGFDQGSAQQGGFDQGTAPPGGGFDQGSAPPGGGFDQGSAPPGGGFDQGTAPPGGYSSGQGSYGSGQQDGFNQGSGQGGYGSGGGQLRGDPGAAYGAGQGNYIPGQEGYGSGGGQLQGDRPWYEKEQGTAGYGSDGSGGGQRQGQGDGNGMGTGSNASPTWTPPPPQ